MESDRMMREEGRLVEGKSSLADGLEERLSEGAGQTDVAIVELAVMGQT